MSGSNIFIRFNRQFGIVFLPMSGIMFFLLVQLCTSQTIDSLLTLPARIDCWDIWYNSGKQIVRFRKESKIDSLTMVLEFWEKYCGDNEPLRRYRIIDKIIKGENINEFIDSNTVYYLLDFRERRIVINADPKKEIIINQRFNYPLLPEFDSMTIALADSLYLSKKHAETDVDLFLLAYSQRFDDFIALSYAKTESEIQKTFNKEYMKYKNMHELNIGLQSGIWVPFGNMSLVGNHPAFGFFVGYKKRKIMVDWTFYMKMLKSNNEYVVYKDGRAFLTNYFFGGYIGLDVACFLMEKSKHKIPLRLGFAIAGWDALKKDIEKEIPSKSFIVPNVNIGIEFMYFLTKFSFLSLELKGTYLKINNDRGTDISGPAMTALLKYGFHGSGKKENFKKYLCIK